MSRLCIIIAAVGLVGCAERAEARAVPNAIAHDTQTIHSPDASRIWIIYRPTDGHDRIVYCDNEMLKQSRVLCVTWPPQ
jgi:hypothetical protein